MRAQLSAYTALELALVSSYFSSPCQDSLKEVLAYALFTNSAQKRTQVLLCSSKANRADPSHELSRQFTEELERAKSENAQDRWLERTLVPCLIPQTTLCDQ